MLQTQKMVRESGTSWVPSSLISVTELGEIRRIWFAGKGEIEDLAPKIYANVLGAAYPGMP